MIGRFHPEKVAESAAVKDNDLLGDNWLLPPPPMLMLSPPVNVLSDSPAIEPASERLLPCMDDVNVAEEVMDP